MSQSGKRRRGGEKRKDAKEIDGGGFPACGKGTCLTARSTKNVVCERGHKHHRNQKTFCSKES